MTFDGAALVTGAAGGIGRAICRRLARAGATILAVDKVDPLGEISADLDGMGSPVVAVQTDLSSDEGVDAVAEAVERLPVPLSVIVNNAGITRDARLVNMSAEDFRTVLEVNLGVAHRLTNRLLSSFAQGAIVNISSRAYLGNFGQFNYSMSKGGLVGMTRAFALALAPAIRVNAVAPGLIATEMSMAIPADVRDKMIAAIPMGRMGLPEEVAETVAFLASDASAYITGEVITVGGGRSLSS
jgi:NAD(P)-dependent dehydrogenase (short-subunit alcohol dehydrogenase family)